jgi:hypothetical protein
MTDKDAANLLKEIKVMNDHLKVISGHLANLVKIADQKPDRVTVPASPAKRN